MLLSEKVLSGIDLVSKRVSQKASVIFPMPSSNMAAKAPSMLSEGAHGIVSAAAAVISSVLSWRLSSAIAAG
jgi:energy-converting hydrogenase Eha subunit A